MDPPLGALVVGAVTYDESTSLQGAFEVLLDRGRFIRIVAVGSVIALVVDVGVYAYIYSQHPTGYVVAQGVASTAIMLAFVIILVFLNRRSAPVGYRRANTSMESYTEDRGRVLDPVPRLLRFCLLFAGGVLIAALAENTGSETTGRLLLAGAFLVGAIALVVVRGGRRNE